MADVMQGRFITQEACICDKNSCDGGCADTGD